MTQPNLIVQPDPERAEWLRQLQIPENMTGFSAFRDFELDVAENGLPQYRSANFSAEAIDKLIAAQLDTISAITHMQSSVKQMAEGMEGAGMPPNPQLASAVGAVDVLPNLPSSVGLRDYMVSVYENGAPSGQLLGVLGALLEKSALALVETMGMAKTHDDIIKGIAPIVDGLSARVNALEQRH
ncbi:hypothetical protein [Mycobacterium szulgai]|uniref:Uncharacterized protein n=1 Tax=Mycobacterium szulgai TaxID=1787 RepID=A0A1X2FLT5_MYCSZ|nr:hypothetical protein [Mycobacterium szulgai]MCV7079839.1 hypothetical protein [Mycobacterium szulgai]ORX19414.1 hypothetical protein AWC27_00095 [Mycobacterium szulgai]